MKEGGEVSVQYSIFVLSTRYLIYKRLVFSLAAITVEADPPPPPLRKSSRALASIPPAPPPKNGLGGE